MIAQKQKRCKFFEALVKKLGLIINDLLWKYLLKKEEVN